MKARDRKTVGRVTVVIHRVTRTTVYFAKFCGAWGLRKMRRAEFQRQWEATK